MKRICPIIVLAAVAIALPALFAGRLVGAPMGTALTYQGQLQQSNPGNIIGQPQSGPVTGVCDFRFSLWDAVTNGNLVGATQTVSAVSVSNGLFTVTLDFGAGAFNGDARWLDIGVRTNGGGAFTNLFPRQLVPLAPYALYAAEAGSVAATNFIGIVPDSQLSSNVALLNSSANFIGPVTAASFAGNGSGLTNLNAADLTGIVPLSNLNPAVVTNRYGDSQDMLYISTNGVSGGSIFLGIYAGNFPQPESFGNIGIGANAMRWTTTNDVANIAIGNSALQNGTNRSLSIGIGGFALYQMLNGRNVTALGFGSGGNVLSATNSIYIGNAGADGDYGVIRIGQNGTNTDTYIAGIIHGNGGGLTDLNITNLDQSVVTNRYGNSYDLFYASTNGVSGGSIFLGIYAGNFPQPESFGNIGIGANAMRWTTTNDVANIAIGNSALQNGTNRSLSIGIGGFALYQMLNGRNVTALGFGSGGNVLSATNSIYIGNAGVDGDYGVIRIGQDGTNTDAYIAGIIHGNGSGLTNVPGIGSATNAINNNNGVGTNLTVYGTLTSTNLNALYDTNNAGIAAALVATNNFGTTVPVNLTNAANQFTGTFTNGSYYGNGEGLTNLAAVNIVGTLTNNAATATYAITAGTATNSPLGPFGSAATNSASAFDTNNAGIAAALVATNNFGTTVPVNMTNVANSFTGTFTNSAYYGNGAGLTNIPTSGISNFLGSITNQIGNTIAVTMTNANNQITGTFTNGFYYGSGSGLTNLQAGNIIGTLTNATTGSAGTATNLSGGLANYIVKTNGWYDPSGTWHPESNSGNSLQNALNNAALYNPADAYVYPSQTIYPGSALYPSWQRIVNLPYWIGGVFHISPGEYCKPDGSRFWISNNIATSAWRLIGSGPETKIVANSNVMDMTIHYSGNNYAPTYWLELDHLAFLSMSTNVCAVQVDLGLGAETEYIHDCLFTMYNYMSYTTNGLQQNPLEDFTVSTGPVGIVGLIFGGDCGRGEATRNRFYGLAVGAVGAEGSTRTYENEFWSMSQGGNLWSTGDTNQYHNTSGQEIIYGAQFSTGAGLIVDGTGEEYIEKNTFWDCPVGILVGRQVPSFRYIAHNSTIGRVNPLILWETTNGPSFSRTQVLDNLENASPYTPQIATLNWDSQWSGSIFIPIPTSKVVIPTVNTITPGLTESGGVVTASNSFSGNGLGLTNIPTSGISNFLGSITNQIGNTIAVTMTNANNQFTGTFTNGSYYGDGGGLTNFGGTVAVNMTNAANQFSGDGSGLTDIGVTVPVNMTNPTNQFEGQFQGISYSVLGPSMSVVVVTNAGDSILNGTYVSTSSANTTYTNVNNQGYVIPGSIYITTNTSPSEWEMWDGTAFYPLLVYTNSALIGTGWKDATGGTYNPPPTVSYGYGFNTVITNGVFTGNGSGLTNIPTSGVSGLGSAATNSASAFDTNNAGIAAALAATNAMGQSSGLAAFQNTNFFDLAGAGTAAALLATNNFGNTIAVNMTNQANTLTVKQLNLTNGWTVTAVTNTFSFSAKNNDDWAFYDYVTNGTLAFYNSGTHSLEYINCSQGFASNGVFLVTAAITNGLATTNYVQSIGTTSAVSMTNQANSFSGTATNFTLYGDANHTNWTYTDTTGWNNTNVAGGSVNIRNGNITASGTNTAGYYVGNGGGLINLQAGNIVGTLTNNAATATYATTSGTATNSPLGALGSAATNSSSAFDTNNAGIAAALAATNAMGQSSGLAAFQNTNFFDLAGAGTAAALLATNNFGNSIAVSLTNALNDYTGSNITASGQLNVSDTLNGTVNYSLTSIGSEFYLVDAQTYSLGVSLNPHAYASYAGLTANPTNNITGTASRKLIYTGVGAYYAVSYAPVAESTNSMYGDIYGSWFIAAAGNAMASTNSIGYGTYLTAYGFTTNYGVYVYQAAGQAAPSNYFGTNISVGNYVGNGSGLTNTAGNSFVDYYTVTNTGNIVLTNNATWFDTNGAAIAAALAATNAGNIVFTNNTTWFDTNGAAIAAAQIATNNFGNSVAVNMTNTANSFAGTVTNSTLTNNTYYGNGGGLTNLNFTNSGNYYVTPDIPMLANTWWHWSNSLPFAPTRAEVMVVCTNADASTGYQSGDQFITAGLCQSSTSPATTYPITAGWNGSNGWVSFAIATYNNGNTFFPVKTNGWGKATSITNFVIRGVFRK